MVRETLQDASQVLNPVRGVLDTPALSFGKGHNYHFHCRSENTRDGQRGRMSPHTVHVLSVEGKPLTPTTASKARKLIRGGVAKGVWSKFNTFGIQLLVETRKEVPVCSLGIDNGTKFEGYSIVIGDENNVNIKLNLPDKKVIVKKLEERRQLRRVRRQHKTRCREARFDNRGRKGFIAPSQLVVVASRLKVMRELMRIYPVKTVNIEDVCFNHARYRWGKNFSTVEIGKTKIRDFIKSYGVELNEFKGWQTKALREKYGYKKISDKAKDCFESHNCDSLALAVIDKRVEPNKNIIVVDDTYRPKRRRLFDTQCKKGGIREKYSTGVVFGLRKGLLVGFSNGRVGRLDGATGNSLYYTSQGMKRTACVMNKLQFVSSNFNVMAIHPSAKAEGLLAEG